MFLIKYLITIKPKNTFLLAMQNTSVARKDWTYAFGGVMEACMVSILSFYSNAFLLEIGISAKNVGIIMIVGRILDALNDPLIGNASDNTISIHGKRRLWMILSIVPTCVSYVLLWCVPPTYIDKTAWYICMFLVFDISLSSYRINYEALTSEMTTDYDERVPLVFKRTLVYIMAAAFSVVCHAWYEQLSDKSDAHVYLSSALTVVAVTLPFAVCCTYYAHVSRLTTTIWDEQVIAITISPPDDRFYDDGTEEIRVELMDNTVRTDRIPRKISVEGMLFFLKCMVRDYARITCNTNYMLLVVVNQLVGVVITVIQSMLLLYVKYVDKSGEARFTDIIMLVQLGVLVGLMATMLLHKNNVIRDKKKTLQVLICVLIVASMGQIAVVHSYVIDFLFGACMSGIILMIQSMLPDVIDVAQMDQGSKYEGSYYAFFSVLQKVSVGLAIAIVNFALAGNGFVSGNPDTQTQAATDTLRMLFVMLPSTLLAMALVPLYFYSVDRDQQQSIRHEYELT